MSPMARAACSARASCASTNRHGGEPRDAPGAVDPSRRPLSAHYRILQHYDLKRDGWDIQIKTETVMTSTKTDLILTGKLDAFEGGKRVASRNWRETFRATVLAGA